MLRIFIGYDPNEVVAYHVLAHSILTRASRPVSISPINLANLPFFNREHDPRQSNEFTYSRFLTPFLAKYEGQAVFMDCDMLCTGDIADLFYEYDFGSAVQVVQHDYTPSTTTKFLGKEQAAYPRKNWSSVMLFDAGHEDCKRLTVDEVEYRDPAYLHRFGWTGRVGELPPEWNYLVGEPNQTSDPPKLIHYTIGGPWFDEYKDCEYADLWFAERDKCLGK